MDFNKWYFLPFLFLALNGFGQTDSTSSFRWGTFTPRIRYFFMHTENNGALSDYYANVLGGGIKFVSKNYKNFQFVLNGSIVGNVYSSDFTAKDPQTQQLNRYEVSLMDIAHPTDKLMARVDEFQLNYTQQNLKITLGKQLIVSPFIHPQDGRMNVTAVEGIWTKYIPSQYITIDLGYLYKISPRSTSQWMSVGSSIGTYSTGVNLHGEKNTYSNQQESDGILLVGASIHPNEKIEIKFWNYAITNIFNQILIQPEYNYPIKEHQKLYVAGQFTYQQTIGNGGNQNSTHSYFQKNQHAAAIGGKIGWKQNCTDLSLNYTHILNKNQFTFPREWGREPFFTFLPRERMEGTAGSHAIALKTETLLHKNWTIGFGLGYYSYSNVANYAQNKYGIPSFIQLNSEFKYTRKNLDILLLHCIKLTNDKGVNNTKYEINKVNLSQINLVLNYQL